MKEEKLLLEVIEELESLQEITHNSYQSESISGGGGWYETIFMGYFDENDRNEMVKKLKQVYEFFEKTNKHENI